MDETSDFPAVRRAPTFSLGLVLTAASVMAPAQTSFAPLSTRPPTAIYQSYVLGHTSPTQSMHVTVSLPPADEAGLTAYADAVSDPTSVNYRNFLTPDQVGQRFGFSAAKVQSIVNYLQSKGLQIDMVAKNRLAIHVTGNVSQVEAAFQTTIEDFTSITAADTGNRRYFSFTTPLQVPANIAPYIATVSGLENHTKPQKRTLNPTTTRVLYDLAPIYNASFQGTGRTIGVSNFDGYALSNVPLYYSAFGLPTPSGGLGSNVSVVTISGGNAKSAAAGEGDLDMQMVLGMAPLAKVVVYDGGNSDLLGVLSKEASDNSCDIITESYGWSLDAVSLASAHTYHLAMTTQGITYVVASGDTGTQFQGYDYPDFEPEALVVGGTVPTVDATGKRLAEIGWSDAGGASGGGWSTNTATFNVLPSWQKGSSVPTGNNHRLFPDVALAASSANAQTSYGFYWKGAAASGVGTSFGSPVFAGSLAIVQQKLIAAGGLPVANGHQRMGRINDVVYAQNGRSDVWFDVTQGTSSGPLPDSSQAVPKVGWDYVTGWGAIDFNAFTGTQLPGAPAAPTGLQVTNGGSGLNLNWQVVVGATSYKVYRSTFAAGTLTYVGTAATNAYTDTTGLIDGTAYYYKVTAVAGSLEGSLSTESSATLSNGHQLLLNPSFENGAGGWQATPTVITNATQEAANTGVWKAWLGGHNLMRLGILQQQVVIPATVAHATLTFQLHIDTTDLVASNRSQLILQAVNSQNIVLATLGTWTNAKAAAGYTLQTVSLDAYKGQTIRLVFRSVEQASPTTSFVLDDLALNAL